MKKWIWSKNIAKDNNFKKETSVTNNKNDNDTDKKQTITLAWMPKTGPKIKNENQKFVQKNENTPLKFNFILF